jgi:hypothetical protein
MLLLIRQVIFPPYWGIPKLSHQFPVEVVVTIEVTGAVEVVVDVTMDVEVEVDVGAVDVGAVDVDVVVVVVVDVLLAQDARTNVVMMRQVNAIPIIPLFNLPSFLFKTL